MDFLKESATQDLHSNSSHELAKFGFHQQGSPGFSSDGSDLARHLFFGSFSDPILVDHERDHKEVFTGSTFVRHFCMQLPSAR